MKKQEKIRSIEWFFLNFYFVLICYHKVKLKVTTFQGPSKNLGLGRSLKFNTHIGTHSLYKHKNFQRGQSMRELAMIILNFPVRPYPLTRENHFRS
jgi:fructose 1,6-bisphosphatase